MVQLITGEKGEGKTKQLLDSVNEAVKGAKGNLVYIDKDSKNMFELNNKVRLIDASSYPLKNSDEFVGFICGIISQDHDLESIYLDSFRKITRIGDGQVNDTLLQLEAIGESFNVNVIISVALNGEELTEALSDKVVIK